jgi:hypothetical protein
MHSHITHTVGQVAVNYTFTNATTGEQKTINRTEWTQILRDDMDQYWRIAISLEALLMVFIPVLLVVIANVLMALSLRQHKNQNNIQV